MKITTAERPPAARSLARRAAPAFAGIVVAVVVMAVYAPTIAFAEGPAPVMSSTTTTHAESLDGGHG